jgi:hypothetical protein
MQPGLPLAMLLSQGKFPAWHDDSGPSTTIVGVGVIVTIFLGLK